MRLARQTVTPVVSLRPKLSSRLSIVQCYLFHVPCLDKTLPPFGGNVEGWIGGRRSPHTPGLSLIFGNLDDVVLVSCRILTLGNRLATLVDPTCVIWLIWIQFVKNFFHIFHGHCCCRRPRALSFGRCRIVLLLAAMVLATVRLDPVRRRMGRR